MKLKKVIRGKICGALFDFEGTLVDFQWKLQPAVDDTLSALAGIGFQTCWYGEYPDYAKIYNYTRELATRGKGAIDAPGALKIINAIYDRYDADALTRWRLYPDTLETLEYLKNSGFKLGLVTNVGRLALQKAVNILGIEAYFGIIITRNDVALLKPHPEGLLKAIKIMDAAPQETIFVGDSRNDIEAGRAAGMPVCYISGGEEWPKNLPKLPVDLEITKLKQIITALK